MISGFFLGLAALCLSLILNAGLLSFIPVMSYFRGMSGVEEKKSAQHVLALATIPKKKEKPKARENLSRSERKAPEPGKSISRSRFVMDLGPGGGSGAVVANAVSRGDLKQAAYEEGETDEDAKPITQVAPKRPKKAEAAGVNGLVRCMLTIGENGRVVDVAFLEVPANYGFEEAVKEALAQWKYQPAIMGGVPVRQKIEQPFKF